MIWLYSGTPGSGKSLNSARAIYYNLVKYKRDVIANFPINMEDIEKKKKHGNFTFIPNSELSALSLIELAKERGYTNNKKEGQCLVVIDEASLIFNSRTWNEKGRKEWLDLFTHHRKYGFNFILVSQFIGQLDKQIRPLIEYDFIHRKWNNYGFMQYFPLRLFLVIEKSNQIKMKNSSNTFFYNKKYCRMYDTYLDFSQNQKTSNA